MQRQAGTYALILRASEKATLQIGRCGKLAVDIGYYVYVGSAFGPGGVLARVRHHCRIAAKPRWHIDYLRQVTEIETVWYSHDPQRYEHNWAMTFGQMRGVTLPLPGFGASDCPCPAHLFFFSTPPSLSAFRRCIRTTL